MVLFEFFFGAVGEFGGENAGSSLLEDDVRVGSPGFKVVCALANPFLVILVTKLDKFKNGFLIDGDLFFLIIS